MKRKYVGVPQVDGWCLVMLREGTPGNFVVTLPREITEGLGLRKNQLVALRGAKHPKTLELKTDLKVLV